MRIVEEGKRTGSKGRLFSRREFADILAKAWDLDSDRLCRALDITRKELNGYLSEKAVLGYTMAKWEWDDYNSGTANQTFYDSKNDIEEQLVDKGVGCLVTYWDGHDDKMGTFKSIFLNTVTLDGGVKVDISDIEMVG